QHFCPKYSSRAAGPRSNPNSKTQLEFNMSKMAAFNLLAAAVSPVLYWLLHCSARQAEREVHLHRLLRRHNPARPEAATWRTAACRWSSATGSAITAYATATSDCRTAASAFLRPTPTACMGARASRECNRRCNGNRDEFFCGAGCATASYEIHREQCECDRKPNA
uniref:MYND-type domain-containing protein n=1 Tax=Macrostomum lignano TaxID=282301 RepID=A0A1I8FC11_9PLAT